MTGGPGLVRRSMRLEAVACRAGVAGRSRAFQRVHNDMNNVSKGGGGVPKPASGSTMPPESARGG